MKKLICFGLTVLFVLSLFSCKNEKENTDTDIGVCDAPLYRSEDISHFVANWQTILQENSGGDAGLNSIAKKSIVVPVLKHDMYQNGSMSIRKETISYTFLPLDENLFMNYISVIVSMEDENGFEEYVQQHSLTAVDGVAYDDRGINNIWVFEVHNCCITVQFPQTIFLESFEEMSDYFDFEKLTAGGNDHVAE